MLSSITPRHVHLLRVVGVHLDSSLFEGYFRSLPGTQRHPIAFNKLYGLFEAYLTYGLDDSAPFGAPVLRQGPYSQEQKYKWELGFGGPVGL